MSKRIQRRSFFRVNVNLPLRCRALPNEDGKEAPWHKGIVRDMSGGGILATVFDDTCVLRSGDKIEVELWLSRGAMPIKTRGVVARVSSGRLARTLHGYEVAVLFTDVNERDRDSIIRHVFNRERELINKVRISKE